MMFLGDAIFQKPPRVLKILPIARCKQNRNPLLPSIWWRGPLFHLTGNFLTFPKHLFFKVMDLGHMTSSLSFTILSYKEGIDDLPVPPKPQHSSYKIFFIAKQNAHTFLWISFLISKRFDKN